MHPARTTHLRRRPTLSTVIAAVVTVSLTSLASAAGAASTSAAGAAPLKAPASVAVPGPAGASSAQVGPSPTAPNPHPPLGGIAPDGTVPGGPALAQRGLILPAGVPPLPKNLPARAWVLADLDTGEILAARDPHGRYQPASILKTLTALTLLPHLPGTRKVTISASAANAEGSAVGLLAGAQYTVDQLFRALFLVSANDAAMALAQANGGAARTVSQMNAEAQSLGAYDTLVQTPSGLDGWKQLTSAYDMTLVLRAALAQPRFLAYDRMPSESFPPKKSHAGSVGAYQFDNQSLDFFDTMPGALVAKTGYTDAALHTFICAAEQHGRRLGLVFLRNQRVPLDQYQQATALLKWGFALPRTTTPVGTLAGPVSAQQSAQARSATDPSGAPGAGLPHGTDPAHPASAGLHGAHTGAIARLQALATSGPLGRTVLVVVMTALVLFVAVGAARLRRRRRRAQRRY